MWAFLVHPNGDRFRLELVIVALIGLPLFLHVIFIGDFFQLQFILEKPTHTNIE